MSKRRFFKYEKSTMLKLLDGCHALLDYCDRRISCDGCAFEGMHVDDYMGDCPAYIARSLEKEIERIFEEHGFNLRWDKIK